MDKLVYSDNGIAFGAKEGWATHSRKDMEDFKGTPLSERNQSEKVIHCKIPNTWHSGKYNNKETV